MGTKSDDAARLELLLGDIRDAFAKESEAASAHLVKELVAIDGRPWAEMGKRGKPLTQNKLARMLKPLAIAPDHIDPKTRVRGYKLSQFEEAFSRYLPPEGVSNRSTVQDAANTGNGGERGLSSRRNSGTCRLVLGPSLLALQQKRSRRRRARRRVAGNPAQGSVSGARRDRARARQE